MLRIALRLHRTGVLAGGGIGVLAGFIQPPAFISAAGDTEAGRLAFGQEMELLGRQVSYLLPLPVRPDTLAGYVQWRLFGFLPLVFAFWALMAAAGIVRGDEEGGLNEQWLAAGVSRARFMALRLLAFTIAAGSAIAVTVLACAAAAAAVGSPLGAAPLAAQGAALLAVAIACFGIALAVAQLIGSRRGAAGLGAGVLLVFFFLNSFSRTAEGLRPFRWISPFYFYDRSNPLLPGGTFDIAATLALALAGAAATAAAAFAFIRRDLGAPLIPWRQASRKTVVTPDSNALLRIPVLASVYEQRIALLFWSAGTAVLAVFMVSFARPTVEMIRSSQGLRSFLALLGPGDPYQAVIGLFWFGIVQLLLAIYAVTQVAHWSAEDGQGRLEMVLSAPIPRWRVVLERGLALTLSCCLIIAAGSVTTGVAAGAQGIPLEGRSLLRASFPLLPLGLCFGALGAAVIGRLPRAAVPLLSAIAVSSYFLQQVAPLFRWPEWVANLSVFQLYGNPLVSGVYWRGLWALLAVTMAGFAVALVTMQRREVGS